MTRQRSYQKALACDDQTKAQYKMDPDVVLGRRGKATDCVRHMSQREPLSLPMESMLCRLAARQSHFESTIRRREESCSASNELGEP